MAEVTVVVLESKRPLIVIVSR